MSNASYQKMGHQVQKQNPPEYDSVALELEDRKLKPSDKQKSANRSWIEPAFQGRTHQVLFIRLMVVVNIALFIYTMSVADWQFASFSLNPLFGPTADILIDVGAKENTAIIEDGEWWRIITPMFLHAGVIHLFLNLLMIISIGKGLEQAFGWWRTATVYLVSGVTGSLASAVFVPASIGVGASGALYGLVGGLLADFVLNHQSIVRGKWCYFMNLILSTTFGLLFGLLPIIDNWAHIGGLVGGFFVGLIMLAEVSNARAHFLGFIGIVATAALIIGLSVSLSQELDANEWCSFCSNLNCVELFWDCDDLCEVTFTNGTSVILDCQEAVQLINNQ